MQITKAWGDLSLSEPVRLHPADALRDSTDCSQGLEPPLGPALQPRHLTPQKAGLRGISAMVLPCERRETKVGLSVLQAGR